MDSETDLAFQAQAIAMLNKNLLGAPWNSYLDKKQLLVMYSEARSMVKKNPTHRKLGAAAESLIGSLARIVRCLSIEDAQAKQTFVRGRVVEMDATALYANAEQEFKKMRQLLAKR